MKKWISRRSFLRLSALASGGALFAACAPKATPTPKPAEPAKPALKATEPPKAKEPVEIRLMAWGNPTEVTAREECHKLFEAAYPDIKVNFLHTPQNYGDKLQTMLAGGDFPDVIYLGNGDIPSYATRNQIAALDAFMARDKVDLSDILTKFYDLYNVNGKQYGICADAPSQQLFYNKTMFEEAGLEPPSSDWKDPGWTWASFLEKAKALTNEKENQYGWQVKNNIRANWIWVTANGGTFFNEDGTKCLLNEPEAVEALQFLADLIHVHKVAPPMDVAAEMRSAELFQSGVTAMETWWPAIGRMRTNVKDFEWDVAPHPEGAVTKTCSGGGTGHTLCEKAPHKEEGWTFMKYAFSGEYVSKWTEIMGIPPILRSVAESDVFLQPGKPPEHILVFIDGADYLRPDPSHVKFPQASSIATSELDYLYAGERGAQEVADSIVEQVNALLAED